MSKTERNFWLDAILFAAILITTITGFILWFVIPHILEFVFLGFSRGVWAAAHISFGDDLYLVRVPDRLHAGFGVASTILMIVHLALHWKWIASAAQRYIHIILKGSNDFQGQENI